MAATVLQRIAAGEATAIEDCLSQYGGLVWSLVRRSMANHADAEDLAQEIFVEIWRHAGRFDSSIASEATFITTLARRRLIDRQRRRQRRPEPVSLPGEADVSAADEGPPLEVLEEAARARELMRQLRPQEREVLEMAINLGMTQSEIAEKASMPLGSVKTHARRGLMRLREMLKASTPGEERESE